MKRILVATASLSLGVFGFMAGCDEGEDFELKESDGGTASDGSVVDAATKTDGSVSLTDGGALDGGADANADAQAKSPWVLVSVNGATSSELVAMRINDGNVAGRLGYDGFIGLTTIDSTGRPFLFQQQLDRVVELDPLEPWKARASWDVKLSDRADGGSSYADPVAIVPATPGKAYVLRFNRNRIAVIDDTVKGDASAPVKTVDLTPFFDPTDTDTSVDPIAAAYVDGKIYVLLANLDLNNVDPKGYFTICTTQKPKLVVLDPTTDTFQTAFAADAGAPADAGPDGGDAGNSAVSVALQGFNPVFGGLVHDQARHRLLVVHGGCNSQLGDGGKGPVERRQVDAVDLTTGVVTKVLDLNGEGFPSAIVRSSGDELIVGFDFYSARRWSVTSSSLGGALPDGLTAIAADGKGKAFGVVNTSFVDGGSAKELVEVPLDGGASRVVGVVPEAGGFVGAADYFAAP